MPTEIEQGWLTYFNSGQVNWFPYNMPYLQSTERLRNVGTTVGAGGIAGGFAMSAFNTISRIPEFSYFGIVPNPQLGISAEGLHLPTLPLIRWDDMAAVLINNLISTWTRAQNRNDIPRPPVGTPNSRFVDMTILAKNGDALKASVPDPHNALVATIYPTASGQHFSTTDMFLDPGLGPEQVIDFMFLLFLMCEQHGIKIYQFGGFMGIMELGSMITDIAKLN